MSKADGQKIGIKFTQPITSDISTLDTSAFTITGQEYNYVPGGVLESTEYEVDSVERHPGVVLYEDDFTGSTDGVEVIDGAVVLESVEGDPVETNIWDGTYTTQYLSGGGWYPQSGDTRTTTKVTVVAGTSYNFLGGNRCRLLWVNDSGTTVSWEDCPNNVPITRVAPVGATGVYYYYTTAGQTDASVTTEVAILEFETSGTYTISILATSLPTNPRLKWSEDLPIGTSITAGCAIAETTPATWGEVDNEDVLSNPQTEGYYLFLRFTLETTDTYVTPTLEAIWLEEPTVPDDKILLTVADTENGFRNVVGDLTLAYNSTLGSLSGLGGPVSSFSTTFTPEDLVRKPDINEPVHIDCLFSGSSLLLRIYYSSYQDEQNANVKLSSVTGSGTLTNVNDL